MTGPAYSQDTFEEQILIITFLFMQCFPQKYFISLIRAGSEKISFNLF